ncbi:MAG: serine/threonine protein kinase [Acidobacteria bacterium]|nr:serine/threonine protein kinase [Acidobacteriota bacterium]
MNPAFPKQIGRYQVTRALGHGGMGSVFLVEDPLLKRRLAIKVVRAAGDEQERDLAMRRFQREAEIAAQFNHPNVVMIFDVGLDPAVGPFLAMEYVEGASLQHHLQKKDLDIETQIRTLIQATRALRAAHRAAIVHRDVKPENILLGTDGRAKLMDFGIAKSFSWDGSPEVSAALREEGYLVPDEQTDTQLLRLTSTGEFLGSPIYTAPEILKGHPATPASDRYSFAATALELMTGCVPHPGPTLPAILNHALLEPPSLPPSLQGTLRDVFDRALASDPEHRQATLMDFMEELIDALDQPVSLRSRLFAFLNQDENTGVFAPPPGRYLHDSGPFPSPLASHAAPSGPKKPTHSKIQLNDDPRLAAQWKTGKIPAYRPPSEDTGFPWLKVVLWVLVAAILIQAYWLLKPH